MHIPRVGPKYKNKGPKLFNLKQQEGVENQLKLFKVDEADGERNQLTSVGWRIWEKQGHYFRDVYSVLSATHWSRYFGRTMMMIRLPTKTFRRRRSLVWSHQLWNQHGVAKCWRNVAKCWKLFRKTKTTTILSVLWKSLLQSTGGPKNARRYTILIFIILLWNIYTCLKPAAAAASAAPHRRRLQRRSHSNRSLRRLIYCNVFFPNATLQCWSG